LKRLKLFGIILIALAIVFAGLRFGNPRIEKANPKTTGMSLPAFEVVAYNSHLLPPIANLIAGKRGNADYRCTKIADQLSKFDIAGVSEVFDEKLAAKMIDEMNANPERAFFFARSPSPTGTFQFAGGGLLLFSRFPILVENSLVFSDGSRFLGSGFKAADGLAAKGALHARLKLDATRELDCFLVHLESFSMPIRKRQVEELAAFVKAHCRAGVPYLLMGDFNIIGPLSLDTSRHKEYNDMVARMTMIDFKIVDVAINPSEGTLAKGTSDALIDGGGVRIDYLLLGIPASNSIAWSASSKTIRFLDHSVQEGSLSDHAAVWARIQFGETLRGD
jgi:endonuclease/exonuclease/phosphatase family metal-dependent hydrolase